MKFYNWVVPPEVTGSCTDMLAGLWCLRFFLLAKCLDQLTFPCKTLNSPIHTVLWLAQIFCLNVCVCFFLSFSCYFFCFLIQHIIKCPFLYSCQDQQIASKQQWLDLASSPEEVLGGGWRITATNLQQNQNQDGKPSSSTSWGLRGQEHQMLFLGLEKLQTQIMAALITNTKKIRRAAWRNVLSMFCRSRSLQQQLKGYFRITLANSALFKLSKMESFKSVLYLLVLSSFHWCFYCTTVVK